MRREAIAGATLLLAVAVAARGQSTAPGCLDSIPPSEMRRAVVFLTTWREDSTSPPARMAQTLVDLYAQSIAQEVRMRLGPSSEQLSPGEPRLTWRSGGSLRVIVHRDGRVTHRVLSDTSRASLSRDIEVARLLAEAVDTLVARDERFGWLEELPDDSLAFDVNTTEHLSSSALISALFRPRVAFPVFTVDEPEIQGVVPRQDGSLRYPERLRAAGIEGQVVARFVVGPDGRYEKGTFRDFTAESMLLLPGTFGAQQAAFADAVREALPRMSFRPAMAWHCPVAQLVQQPFTFELTRDDVTTVAPRGRRLP